MTQALAPHERHRHYKYYDLCMVGFVTVLLCSNLIGPGKVCQIALPFSLPWGSTTLTFGAGNLFFPIGFIFGDILTEVYGYARARKVIWAGFAAMIFATLMSYIIIALPPNPDEPFNRTLQPALETVYNGTWRITVASLLAYWLGDFANSFVLAKMKLLTRGKYLWTRTIGSTIVGQGVDSIIFYPLAFFGLWTGTAMFSVIIFNWLFKTTVEIVMTPVTYKVVNFLKRAESENFFDYDTNFTPFSLED
jgi:queuosine precursor transporter